MLTGQPLSVSVRALVPAFVLSMKSLETKPEAQVARETLCRSGVRHLAEVASRLHMVQA